MLYPTLGGRREWTSGHWAGRTYNITGRIDANDPQAISGMRGDGTLAVAEGILTMAGSQPRIYIYPYNGTTWRDVEFTAYYMRVTDANTAYAGLVMGARSGADGHTTQTPCDAHTYYSRVRNDHTFDFEKELKHPASAPKARVAAAQAWPPNGQMPFNQWIGWKFVIYNVGNTVKFEAYRDLSAGVNGGTWVKVNQTVDNGGWFVDTNCAEHNQVGGRSDMIQLEGGVSFIRNTGPTDARYRWVSVREIQAP